MARYIDADELKSTLKNLPQWGGEVLLLAVLNTVDRQFTADVAPRAEVEKLQEVNADLNESLRLAAEANKDLRAVVDRLRFNLKAVLDERAEDKAEVAREIFEEIEKTVNDCVVDESLFKPAYFEFRKFNEHLTALKKKYTEEQ